MKNPKHTFCREFNSK